MDVLRIVSIDDRFFKDYSIDDNELLNNTEHGLNRPYVIIAKLKFLDGLYDFAIPFRSNITGRGDKTTYFSLPPRKETRAKSSHGLDFIKMFPVDKSYFLKYNYPENNKSAALTRNFIQKNFGKIVACAQKYLDEFAEGNRHEFCVDIIKVYNNIHNIE